MEFKRVDADDRDFQHLVQLLDKDLQVRDGAEHGFYAQFNKIDAIRHAIVATEQGQVIGCGAFKAFDSMTVEIKRMYVKPAYRGQGVAVAVLQQLEDWAVELGYHKFVLETGKKQPEAIRLYQKAGYLVIPNYGQYKNVENSICMRKVPSVVSIGATE